MVVRHHLGSYSRRIPVLYSSEYCGGTSLSTVALLGPTICHIGVAQVAAA